MSIPEWPDGEGPRVLTLAGNDLTIDSRARKTAASLAEAGFRVIALGLDASATLPRSTDFEGANLVRVTPRTDPSLSPRLTRWGYSGAVDTLAFETEIQRSRLQSSRRNLVADQRLRAGSPTPSAETAARVAGGVMRRARIGDDTRARVVRGIRAKITAVVNRMRLTPRRFHTLAIQRRYQVTSVVYRAGVRGSKRRSARFRSWRRDLPEMHKWEAAIGPLVDALQPDLVHCHDIFHLGLAIRARARSATPFRVVYDAQEFIPGLPSDPWRRAAYASLEDEYIRSADAIITVSQGLADLLADEYGVSATLVTNAPNREVVEGVDGVRSVVGLDDDAYLLSFVGGLAPDRGADVVIDSLAHLPEHVHVVFVTNAVGGYADVLVEQATTGGVADRVHFAPFVAPEEVTAYIASSDASVIALSRDVINYEIALPNKLFQAVHAGIAVVVSDNPEMDRFVRHHGIGSVYRGGEPASLADGVREVMERRDEIEARLAEPALLDELSWERQADVLLGVYAGIGVQR